MDGLNRGVGNSFVIRLMRKFCQKCNSVKERKEGKKGLRKSACVHKRPGLIIFIVNTGLCCRLARKMREKSGNV